MARGEAIGTEAVARLAGVSTATVSNALNRPEKVLPATRQKVLDAIATLEYVPNRAAAALRQGTSRLLGLVIPDIENPFYAAIARGVTEEAAGHDWTVALCVTNDDSDAEIESFDRLAELRAAGVLVVPRSADSGRLRRLEMVGTHLVFIDRTVDEHQCSVVIDDVAGGRLAVDHLLARHGPAIALVNGPLDIPQCRDRREGALQASRGPGAPMTVLTEHEVAEMTVDAGHLVGAQLAADPPDGVFCTNDQLAVGVIRGLREAGVDIPRQVGVVGYGDLSLATDGVIRLTTVRQPKHELGRSAVRHLLAEVAGGQKAHVHERVVFEPTLIVRDSTRQLSSTDAARYSDEMPSVEEDRMPGSKRDGVERVCFRMQLKPERIEEYLEAHEVVWPEMLDALRETGWRDYSLFIDRTDGLVVGVLETDDYERAQAEMARRDVNARWQATMADYFVGSENPDSSSRRLTEYFHLA